MIKKQFLWMVSFFTLSVAHELLTINKTPNLLQNSTGVTVEFNAATSNKSSTNVILKVNGEVISNYHDVVDARVEVLNECYDVNSSLIEASNLSKSYLTRKIVKAAFLPESCLINKPQTLENVMGVYSAFILYPNNYSTLEEPKIFKTLLTEKFPDKMIVVLDYKDFATSNLLYEIENSDFIRASFRLYNKDKELVVYIRSNDDVYYYSSDQFPIHMASLVFVSSLSWF